MSQSPKKRSGLKVARVAGDLIPLIEAGEEILEIDGNAVEDVLDFHFYSVLSLSPQVMIASSSGETRTISLESHLLDPSNLEFEPMQFKTCGNDCVFCFIHQMPPGLREDLYFMDEDYRLGFMFGNYVTLALAREKELLRITRQQLSPVYVSVHATNMELRNRLLGLKKSRDILSTIQRLCDEGITVHTQIVLLPGWNDGEELKRSMEDLARLSPGVASLGVVPVGLTDFRSSLPSLQACTPQAAGLVIDQVENFQKQSLRETGTRFVFLADEFYLLSERDLPMMEEYEDFPLSDNGIGMSRDFIEAVRSEASSWSPLEKPQRITILTGILGERVFREFLEKTLSELEGLEFKVRALKNSLFGEKITVSGLLPGRVLLKAAIEEAPHCDLLLLPPNCLNASDLFLDDLSLSGFRDKVPVAVAIPEEGLLSPLLDH
ncbi:MAG: DUF512 domain-containing protein [Candidatus Krumholzibacteria bacterium]|jgi:putative radical SAM enzyme (TIGR03279 family)|nr:DUF512 domain-containing protein [Candidatus Krumholzibacteria bacterium]MDP7020892.1 DUF512 domain-containing protein [Candidatus Krumholzibacteria bacterium]